MASENAHLSFMRIRCKLSCHQSYDPHLPGGDVVTMSRGVLMTRLELTAVVFIHVYGLVAWGDPTAGKDGKKTAATKTSTNINHPSFQDIMKQRFAGIVRLG